MIKRFLTQKILKDIKSHTNAIVLYGARQVGKTTLTQELITNLPGKTLSINADESRYLSILSSRDSDAMKSLIDPYDLICIDEAQRIQDVSINLKILIDSFPHKKFIFTGSSSFELRSAVKESLAGRVMTYVLYPLWTRELKETEGLSDYSMQESLQSRLLYGSYPGVHLKTTHEAKKILLKQIMDTSLLKDMTLFMKLDQEVIIYKLLQLLAYQIGQEVSMRELSTRLGVSAASIRVYLHVLEQSFIIFTLGGYSGNLRKEVTRNPKVYFWDTGIRNALIENFDGLDIRNDIGALWENFVISERLKQSAYTLPYPPKTFFWRLYTGSEIDFIEKTPQSLAGYEIKWSVRSPPPHAWTETYPKATYTCVSRDNWLEFVT